MELCNNCEKEIETTNPVWEIIKKCAKTKLFLFAIIAFTIAVILNVVNFFVHSDIFGGMFWNIFTRVGINTELFPDMFFWYFFHIIIKILGVIAPIVLAIGIWITYFSVKNKSVCQVKLTGIKLVRIMMMVFMVFSCVALLQSVITFLAFGSLFDGLYGENLLMSLVLILIFGAGIVLMIVYYLKLFKFVGSVKLMVETGVATQIPRFIFLASIVFGCISVIYTLSSGVLQLGTRLGDVRLAIAINLISALATILFGIFLLSFGERINDLVKKQNKRA